MVAPLADWKQQGYEGIFLSLLTKEKGELSNEMRTVLMPMQDVCTHFSHKLHNTAGSLPLTSLIQTLQRCFEKNIFSTGMDGKLS